MTGKDLARHLIYSLSDYVDDERLKKGALWREAGVSDKKLARAVARGNMDLAGFLSLMMAAGYTPKEFLDAFPYREGEDDGSEDDG